MKDYTKRSFKDEKPKDKQTPASQKAKEQTAVAAETYTRSKQYTPLTVQNKQTTSTRASTENASPQNSKTQNQHLPC